MNISPAMFGQSTTRPEGAILGIGYELLISAEATSGLYELMKFVVPKGLGPPLHMHTNEDECYFVLEGKFEMIVGDKRIVTSSGDYIHLPRNLPHAIRNIGEEMGSFLCWVSPGNLGSFFNTFKKPWPADQTFPPMLTGADIQMMMQVANEYGIEVLTTEP